MLALTIATFLLHVLFVHTIPTLGFTAPPFVSMVERSSSSFHQKNSSKNHHSANSVDASTSQVNDKQCASWLPNSQRKILLVGFRPLTELSWLSEEFHLTMDLVMLLPYIGFDISYMEASAFERQVEQQGTSNNFCLSYHLIFYMLRMDQQQQVTTNVLRAIGESTCCNMRVILPVASVPRENDELDSLKLLLHEKQILTTFAIDGGTMIPYYPRLLSHEEIMPYDGNFNEIKSVGTLFMPHFGILKASKQIIQRLLRKGLEINIFLEKNDVASHHFNLSSNAHVHSSTSPCKLLPVLKRSAFLMVWDGEYPNFLSLLALFHGASVIKVEKNDTKSQLEISNGIGIPFVYKAKVDNLKSIMKAVTDSINYRFTSHQLFSRGEFEDTLCALVEDNSVCMCSDARSHGDDHVDCRSSFYMKKSPIFPQME